MGPKWGFEGGLKGEKVELKWDLKRGLRDQCLKFDQYVLKRDNIGLNNENGIENRPKYRNITVNFVDLSIVEKCLQIGPAKSLCGFSNHL